MVNGIHVVTVESNAKINIGVNGIHVVSVESFEKITATCHFLFHDVLRRGENGPKINPPELKLYYKRQTVSNSSSSLNMFISHVMSVKSLTGK